MSRKKHVRVAPSAELPVTATGGQQKPAPAPILKRSGAADKRAEESDEREREEAKEEGEQWRAPLVWTNIILFVILHSALPIGFYMISTRRPWKTLLWALFGVYASVLGVTAGTHRLWSHRSYKARWPVQVLLMALQTMAGQNSIYTWARDHRVHHKFSETDADPHNIKRGFFFAHMGWLCCKKHPEVKAKGVLVDMSDLEANPVVMFQHRHFWWLAALFTVSVPTLVPVLLWAESLWTAFVVGFMWRYIISLHGTWLVNSAAHYHGARPYDGRIEARESPVVIWTGVGEGFHNFHHTFPQDYSTSEFGAYFNITTAFIDLCALAGLAHDRRKMDARTVESRKLRTGDVPARPPAVAASLATTQTGKRAMDGRGERDSDSTSSDDGIELTSSSRPPLVARDWDQIKMKYSL